MTTAAKQNKVAFVAVVICTVIGLSLSFQGWRSHIPSFDLVTAMESAQDLLVHGRLPDRGILTSFASYTPPGVVWLMLPGVTVFKDPRLFEFAGSGLLFLGTLAGVFFLTRAYFGPGCAFLALALYSLSQLGLQYSASLWPRGQPFFYVWMAYCVGQWVEQRRPHFLAAALVTWAAGMYVFLEIAPAVFILPVIWIIYRPPITLSSVAFSGMLILAMWYPYLHFEYSRDFADLRSQVFLQPALPNNYRDSWCDPNLVLRRMEDTAQSTLVGNTNPGGPVKLRSRILARLTSLWGRWSWLPSNFEYATRIPGGSVALTLMTLVSLFMVGLSSEPGNGQQRHRALRLWSHVLTAAAVTSIVCGLLFNEWIIARYLSVHGTIQASTISAVRGLQLVLVSGGILLLALRSRIIVSIDRLKLPKDAAPRQWDPAVFALSLIVPWSILLILVESAEHLERFWWLWPLQLIALAALAWHIPGRLGMARVGWIASAALAVLLLLHPRLLGIPASLAKGGWSGTDAEEVRLVDYVARHLDGRNQVALGYQIPIWRFMATFNAVDPRYKVGADFDLLYERLHGITNSNQCGEGVSPGDEFRIVQTTPTWTNPEAKGYFDIAIDKYFHPVAQFGPYQLFQRF